MQRIGRVDRRMNPEIENKILEDHPDTSKRLEEPQRTGISPPPGELDTSFETSQKSGKQNTQNFKGSRFGRW